MNYVNFWKNVHDFHKFFFEKVRFFLLQTWVTIISKVFSDNIKSKTSSL